MGQRQPFSATDDNAWLSNLVAAFARTEELRSQPCSAVVLSAAMVRLQRPAAVRRPQIARRSDVLELSF